MKQKHTVEVSNLWRSARADTLKPYSNAMETPRSPLDAFRWMHRYCHARTVKLRWHIGFGLVFGTFVQGPAVKLQSGRRFIRKIMTHWLSRGSPRDGRPPPAIWTDGRTDGSEHWLYEQFSTSYRRSFVNALVPSRPGLGAQ
jgi:hypothetical protein